MLFTLCVKLLIKKTVLVKEKVLNFGVIKNSMTIKINDVKIHDSHKHVLREAYAKIYADFQKKNEEMIVEWNNLSPILKELEIITDSIEFIDKPQKLDLIKIDTELIQIFERYHQLIAKNEYSVNNWAWLTKISYILKIADKPLTANEINIVLVYYYEKELPKDKIINSIPATLSMAARDNKLIRAKRSNGDFEYFIHTHKNIQKPMIEDDLPF